MRRNAFQLIGVLLILLLISCSSRLMSPRKTAIHIIPRPVSIVRLEGEFLLDAKAVVTMSPQDSELSIIAEKLRQKINAASSFEVTISPGVSANQKPIGLSLDASLEHLGEEGYQLTVLPGKIEITAPRPAGVFYGMQSLVQLLPIEFDDPSVRRNHWQIPCMEIIDYPRFQWRGQLLDVSRHFHPVDQIKHNLDHLARLKMNRFHWHLTDDQGWRIEIKSLPHLTEIGAWRVDHNDKDWWQREFAQPGEKATYGGYYTQEQIRDVIKYAQERYITIVPEIDMPGHSRTFLAAYPEVSCDGGPYFVATGGDERNKDLCPGKEITFQLVEKVIDEVTALFPGQYYHIGGDECRKHAWKLCPDCKRRMETEGLRDFNELQSYFIQRVEKMINARGKIMIGWDEILEGGLAPNATVMSWRGEAGGIESVQKGHDAIMTPFSYCYLDLKQGDPALEPKHLGYSQLLLSTVYSYNPVPTSFSADQAKRILGVQGNLWSEYIQSEKDANYMLFPRLLAIAEVGWTPQPQRDWRDFVCRLETMLQRFDVLGINYATSAYNVWIEPEHENRAASSVAFQLVTEAGTSEIHYTLDGSEPTRSSQRYKTPINLNRTTTVKARSFKHGKPLGSAATVMTIAVHRAAGKNVRLATPPAARFDHGSLALTDCIRGRADQIGKYWLGFEGDFEAVVDLGNIMPIQAVTISLLEATDDRVFLPQQIDLFDSADGENFRRLKTVIPEQRGIPAREVKEITLPISQSTARFLKIQAKNLGLVPSWHQFDPGKKAWLLIDEILVE